jgi:L-serine deaminase
MRPTTVSPPPREEARREGSMDKVTRLSINLSREAAAALKDIKEKRGLSYTEAIRRAIAVYKFVEDETAKGHRIQVVGDGDKVRELMLLS